MTHDELKKILTLHADWYWGRPGGVQANLIGANLIGANLSRANLSRANLSRANLSRANLSEANLSEANLIGANLSRANLSEANLSRAKWSAMTRWPAITAVLLANWGEVSDDLCADLMRYDAATHPDPAAFDRWAHGDGQCPYSGLLIQRAAQFTEHKSLWSPGSVRPYDVFQRLLAEKLVKVDA